MLAASADGPGARFGAVSGLHLSVVDDASGTELLRFDSTDASSETAFVLGELYRRGDGWKLRAVGQGYDTGLAGLAADFGISVDDAPAPAAVPSSQVDLRKQKRIDLEKRMEREAPAMLSLVKKAAVSLEKHGLVDHRARVALCLDISASMSGLYRSGVIQALAERVLALGLRFDDDGEIDVFLFGAKAHNAGSMALDNHGGFVDRLLARYPLEGGTKYDLAMAEIRRYYFPDGGGGPRQAPRQEELPVYVMFVTDGQTSAPDRARQQVVWSAYEPLFWQFMAIGQSSKAVDAGGHRRGFLARAFQSDFQFLEELDEMPGRYLDNASFFSVADPRAVPDEQLYELLMAEYPGWVQGARRGGLLYS